MIEVGPLDDLWQMIGDPLPPLSEDVHVWRIVLDRSEARIRQLRSVLSDDEGTRADRFYAARDRDHFVVGRGSLRTILGRYLGVSADRLTFKAGPFGKPMLSGEWQDTQLEFNLSHSKGLAVLALAGGRRVGVDIEAVRPIREMDGLVMRFFSTNEQEAFLKVPIERRPAAFFRTWTRKEAYIKAIGTGLSTPLDSFDVGVDHDSAPGLLAIRDLPDEPARWTMRDLDPGGEFMGSLVVEGSGWGFRGFEA